MEHGVGVEHERGVGPDAVVAPLAIRAVGPVRERAVRAVVEPRDAGGDVEAMLLEQPGVVHHGHQPLREDLAVGAAELGDVGVHRQLLARDHQVGVGDDRLHHRPSVHPAGGVDEALAVEERLDPVDADLGPVGVLLAEVARAGGQGGEVVVVAVQSAGAEEVEHGVVALGQPASDLAVDLLVLRVAVVAAEALAQLDHRVGAVVEERVDRHDGVRRHRDQCRSHDVVRPRSRISFSASRSFRLARRIEGRIIGIRSRENPDGEPWLRSVIRVPPPSGSQV